MGTEPCDFRIFRGAHGVAEALGHVVVAFGKFDGVHHGHHALVERARAAGRRLGLPAGAATFVRHPNAYLRPGAVPPALTGLADRLRLLRAAGAAFVVLFPTDPTVLGLTAEEFAGDVLRDRMGVRLVVVGRNFRFGRGGSGDVATLRRLVSVTGLDGVEIEMATVGDEVVSSTRIREHLAHGDVGRAGALLGRPYEVLGRVDTGGPPAVVLVSARRVVPAPGLYRAVLRPRGAEPEAVVVAVEPFTERAHRVEVQNPTEGDVPSRTGRGVHITFVERHTRGG